MTQDLLASKRDPQGKTGIYGILDVDNSEWYAHDKRRAWKTKGVLSKSGVHNQGKDDGDS